MAFTSLPQNYIARFGHGSAKLARQAQSKEKTLQKMVASGLTEKVVNDKVRRCKKKLLLFPLYLFDVGIKTVSLIN